MLRRALSDLPGVALVRRPIYVPRERGLMIADLLVVGTKQMIPSAPLTSRLLRRSAPRNDGCLRCHCERSEAISAMGRRVPDVRFAPLGGKENKNTGSYNREDCRRWSERFAIPMSYPDPDVFHERAQRWAASPFDREELPARAFYAADPGKRDCLDQLLFEAAWVEGLDVNEPATIGWAAERAGLDPKHLMAALNEPGPAAKMRSALEEFERLQCPGVPTVIVDGRRFFGKDRVDWVADFCRAQAAVHQTVA